MTCDDTREWLLSCDQPTVGSAEALAHLETCPACRQVQAGIVRIEENWRARPLPARSQQAKHAFLERLATPARPEAKRTRRFAVPSWVMAAAVFLVVGSGILFFWPTQQVEAHPDVLDQLIEWNLQMSEASTAADRKRIYRDRHELLKRSLKQARLNQQEHDLGESLLDNGAWMADNEDPVEELQRFNQVADRLLEHVHFASTDAPSSDRFARNFRMVSERGIERGFDRIKPEKIVDPEHKVKFIKLIKADAERIAKIINMVDLTPDITTRELKRALELSNKRHKPRKNPAP